MIIEIIVEFFVELLAYGTYGIMDCLMGKLPLHWNKRVRKLICVLLSILVWVGIAYVIIKILEFIL